MPKPIRRTRYYAFPYHEEIFDAHLERVREEPRARGRGDIVVDFLALRPLGEPEIAVEDGRPVEALRAERVPLSLRFSRARWHSRVGVYEDLDELPPDHRARQVFDVFHQQYPGNPRAYWFFTNFASEAHHMAVRAESCVLEERSGAREVVQVRRRWAKRPPTPLGLIPRPVAIHRRYGGDPVAIRLGRRAYRNRLFIGGLPQQSDVRPIVDHVLNLCEVPNAWVASRGAHPADRHTCKGEMTEAMPPEEILFEARRVVRRLRAGERVLVHCAGGINRSSTICCASLMLLEGIDAEEALARVRVRHPEADPDPYHWFSLRWLSQRAASDSELLDPRPERTDAPVLAHLEARHS